MADKGKQEVLGVRCTEKAPLAQTCGEGLCCGSCTSTPTVSLGVTYVMVYTYGCDDGKIAPTRCAVIDGGLGDRGSQRQAYRIPPGGARSTRSALAAVSRPASAADPGGFH